MDRYGANWKWHDYRHEPPDLWEIITRGAMDGMPWGTFFNVHEFSCHAVVGHQLIVPLPGGSATLEKWITQFDKHWWHRRSEMNPEFLESEEKCDCDDSQAGGVEDSGRSELAVRLEVVSQQSRIDSGWSRCSQH